jgi:hypothetical protein
MRSKVVGLSRLIAGMRVSIPLRGMDFCPLCLLCLCVGSGLCYGLINRSEESYRVCMSNCVWSRKLKNEAIWARVRLFCHRHKKSHSSINHIVLPLYKKKRHQDNEHLQLFQIGVQTTFNWTMTYLQRTCLSSTYLFFAKLNLVNFYYITKTTIQF